VVKSKSGGDKYKVWLGIRAMSEVGELSSQGETNYESVRRSDVDKYIGSRQTVRFKHFFLDNKSTYSK
jgi:hypothetical protein